MNQEENRTADQPHQNDDEDMEILGLNQRQQSQTPILMAKQIIQVPTENDAALKIEIEEQSDKQAKSVSTTLNAKNKKKRRTSVYKSLVKSMLSEHAVQQELEAAAMLRKSEIETQEVHVEEIEEKLFADQRSNADSKRNLESLVDQQQ